MAYKNGSYLNRKCLVPCQLLIRFNDGYQAWYRKCKVTYGSFRNPYTPSFWEIGRIGNEFNKYHYLFKRWRGMIERCYNPYHKSYSYYGGNEVYVDYRWLTFENYAKDCEKIKGFDLINVMNGNLQLDKDSIGNGKLYSKETCIWISREENQKYGYH